MFTYPQLFLHFHTFERSIRWNRAGLPDVADDVASDELCAPGGTLAADGEDQTAATAANNKRSKIDFNSVYDDSDEDADSSCTTPTTQLASSAVAGTAASGAAPAAKLKRGRRPKLLPPDECAPSGSRRVPKPKQLGTATNGIVPAAPSAAPPAPPTATTPAVPKKRGRKRKEEQANGELDDAARANRTSSGRAVRVARDLSEDYVLYEEAEEDDGEASAGRGRGRPRSLPFSTPKPDKPYKPGVKIKSARRD